MFQNGVTISSPVSKQFTVYKKKIFEWLGKQKDEQKCTACAAKENTMGSNPELSQSEGNNAAAKTESGTNGLHDLFFF